MQIAAILLACGWVVAADWPVWLGPDQDGSSRETGWLKEWAEAGPARLFEREIGEGFSPVVVAEGCLILFHRLKDELVVENLDAVSGKPQWRFSYPTEYADRYGYNGGPRCSPVIDTTGDVKRIFTLGPAGVLHALELATGKMLWSRDLQAEFRLEENFFGVGAAPIIDGERIFVNLGGTELRSGLTLALEKASGKLAWKTPSGGGSYAAGRIAEIDGARQLFIFHRNGLSCLDPKSGCEKWEFHWRSRAYESVNATTPVVAGDIVFVSAAYRTGSAALRVKKDSYEVLWMDDPAAREKIMESHWSNINLVDGYLYGFSGRHEPEAMLTCVELKTGKVEWRWESYLGRGSMLRADGHFIALGERGDLALLKLSPKGHEEVQRPRRIMRYPAWAPPVIANGILYLRDESRIVYLDLRPPKGPEKSGPVKNEPEKE